MTKNKPQIFIGSSKESLPVLEIISDSIKDISIVVTWTDQDKFRRPGTFFLDSLINAANCFDIAILVLGKDDVILSRNKQMPAPRDNVIFELGLFMSVLDRERTLIVSPRVWKEKLKILSDLTGLNLAEYDRPRKRSDLPTALKPVIDHLREQIQSLNLRARQYAPAGVSMVWENVEKLLQKRGNVPHKIENIALDMEVTWRWIKDHVLDNPDRQDLSLYILFLDYQSEQFAKFESDSVSMKTAYQREIEIVQYFRSDLSHLHNRNISVSIRAYKELPVVHGFLFNDEHLFISVCGITDGKLVGSPNPYLVYEKPSARARDLMSDHFHKVYRGWFDELWSHSRKICNT